MKTFSDASLSIGNTPLVKINNLTAHPNLYAKIESRNPSGSIKCRIGANMIWQAEQDKTLKPGMTILEATSGNTGISLAANGRARGYKVTLVMPESMSVERRRVMAALGAEIILTAAADGMQGAVDKAAQLHASGNYCLMKQFENPANPAIHRRTTGVEIWQDTAGKIDIFVAGVGTGGTISGVSEYIKKDCNKPITAVAVEPAESPLISQTLKGEKLTPAGHKIQGIGANFIPKNLNLSMVDQAIAVTSAEAIATTHKIMQQEGILAGISCGAAMHGALKIANDPANQDKVIVVILPDSAERYLSTALFEPN